MFQSFPLSQLVSKDDLVEWRQWIEGSVWNKKVPGGFVVNSPQRWVNTYGDGSMIDSQGQLYGPKLEKTYWTAKMSQNQVSLRTPSQPLPKVLRRLVPPLRKCLDHIYPGVEMTDNTFSIAVCNYYTEPEMYIAAHRDDNVWYPREKGGEPVFASLTFYPKEKPDGKEEYARFQVRREGGTWEPVYLEDESVVIMPSNLEHRVMPFKGKNKGKKKTRFCPRINITFRSLYPRRVNPLMHLMGVSNHNRYYRRPDALLYPKDLDNEVKSDLVRNYNRFLSENGYPLLEEIEVDDKAARTQEKRKRVAWYRQGGYEKFRVAPNMVLETFRILGKVI